MLIAPRALPSRACLGGYAFLVTTLLLVLPLSASSLASVSDPSPKNVALWTVFEASFTSSLRYDNPLQDVDVGVDFESPSGKKISGAAFWDGGSTWRVRFSPDELGKWSYLVRSSRPDDIGLNGQTGTFTCVAYTGRNHLYRHGAVRVSSHRRFLEQADGTPFLWLSDTAWNGALKSQAKDWDTYLNDRSAKGFSVVQFVMTQWIASAGNGEGRLAYQNWKRIYIDPTFYQWMDDRVRAVNDHGLIAAPVMLWAAPWNEVAKYTNPGNSLDESQLIRLARYMVARYAAYQVIWILAGDGDYRGEAAELWKHVAGAAFGDHPSRLVTTHPAGHMWVGEEFGSEPWYSILGYQSGYGDGPKDFQWHTKGPPATEWQHEPVHPVIDLEANYEGHLSSEGVPFDPRSVRRSAYWALLVSPTAGFTYGAHGIWSWETRPAIPMNHGGTGVARPWFEAMKFSGSTDMKHMRDFFSSVDWWTLRPAPDLVIDQPGEKNPAEFIALARSEKENYAVLYMPVGQRTRIKISEIIRPAIIRWFDPRTGAWSKPVPVTSDGFIAAPDSNDWTAWIGPATSQPVRRPAGESK